MTALAWALREMPEDLYQTLKRDMAEPLPKIGIAGYTPAEISHYLFSRRYHHVIVDMNPEYGSPDHWAVGKGQDILRWMKGEAAMLAFVLERDELNVSGHWIGHNGSHLNNLKVLGFEQDVMSRTKFLQITGIDKDWVGKAPDGRDMRLQTAVIIEA